MGKILFGISLLFQVVLTFIVLFGIYMVYAFLDVLEIDMMGGLGFIIFQPILAFIITSLTILACLVVGLPIRLIKKVRMFWLSWPIIPLIGAVTGLLLMFTAYISNFTEIKEVT